MATTEKKKIVILGGGMGGMAAAFGLTEAPDWQDRYDITVYQLGWRLGGKGASGRNAALDQRIQEHGLHVWGGFYENAFRVIRACYEELDRPPTAPLATWDTAFKPNALVTWMEDLVPWIAWNSRFPEYDSTPGDGTAMPSLWEGILRILEWIVQTYFDLDGASGTTAADEKRSVPEWIVELIDAVPSADRQSGLDREVLDWLEQVASDGPLGHLSVAHRLMHSAQHDPAQHSIALHQALVWLLDQFQAKHLADTLQSDDDNGPRRAAILIDLGIAEIKGIISDGVLIGGFDAINNIDLMDWFAKHGAQPASVQSGLVRGSYDFIFAYEGGDPARPLLEAGTGLRMIFRLIMWYKGAVFWKMQAGMGDTIFAPLYQVLSARGVSFKFFQNILNITPTGDGTAIASIQIGEQATLKSGPYQPLVMVKDLPCWPSTPLYDQLVQGAELQAQDIDLESPWAPWPPVAKYDLIAGPGNDFDIVILATSMAPIADIAPSLVAANADWQAMMANVRTVQTQAFQLWMTPNLLDLGWTDGPTILTGYGHPFETWADMSQVIPCEVWPPNRAPGSIAYFCGALPDATPIPPFSDHGFPAEQTALAKQNAVAWIERYILGIWPLAGLDGTFNWELLDDPASGSGVARFDSQYWRANIAPAERYVLSVPNSTSHKLRAGASGFANLYLAGDWLKNGLDFGCIESATMGGLQASQAICGYPKQIVGEHDGI